MITIIRRNNDDNDTAASSDDDDDDIDNDVGDSNDNNICQAQLMKRTHIISHAGLPQSIVKMKA